MRAHRREQPCSNITAERLKPPRSSAYYPHIAWRLLTQAAHQPLTHRASGFAGRGRQISKPQLPQGNGPGSRHNLTSNAVELTDNGESGYPSPSSLFHNLDSRTIAPVRASVPRTLSRSITSRPHALPRCLARSAHSGLSLPFCSDNDETSLERCTINTPSRPEERLIDSP